MQARMFNIHPIYLPVQDRSAEEVIQTFLLPLYMIEEVAMIVYRVIHNSR